MSARLWLSTVVNTPHIKQTKARICILLGFNQYIFVKTKQNYQIKTYLASSITSGVLKKIQIFSWSKRSSESPQVLFSLKQKVLSLLPGKRLMTTVKQAQAGRQQAFTTCPVSPWHSPRPWEYSGRDANFLECRDSWSSWSWNFNVDFTL